MAGPKWRRIRDGLLLSTLAVFAIVYVGFGVTYSNPNWMFSPPNAFRFEGRIYQPSYFEPTETLPPRSGRSYEKIGSLTPFGQSIYGLEGAELHMGLFVHWRGRDMQYGILGGP
ncbi:hypothetical protein ACHIPZ_21360 [Antrihabitans sp. NCIMB 15449]|uniref:Uncharacterized protein n=1 Tax=Antrihabitans spumae TaxID=3373370 RepID=A0ABW7JSC7_9NOCA